MPIEFSCNNCNKMLRVPDGTEGKASQCPACGSVSTIPSRSNLSSIVATSSKVDDPQDKPLDDGLVRVTCPKCQYPLRCQPELIGTKGQCKQCKHIFVIGETSVAAVELTSLVFSCPKCDQLFDGKPEMEGRKGKCHSCGEVFPIKLRQAESESEHKIDNSVKPSSVPSATNPKPSQSKPSPRPSQLKTPATTSAVSSAAASSMQVICGSCKGTMEVPSTAEGKTVACPHCQQLLQIPGREGSPSTPKPSIFDQPSASLFDSPSTKPSPSIFDGLDVSATGSNYPSYPPVDLYGAPPSYQTTSYPPAAYQPTSYAPPPSPAYTPTSYSSPYHTPSTAMQQASNSEYGGNREWLVSVASWQSRLSWNLLIYISSYVLLFAASFFLAAFSEGPGQPPPTWMLITFGVLGLIPMATGIMILISYIVLCLKVYESSKAILYIVGIFVGACVPFLPFILMIITINHATGVLRSYGIRAGFMGADPTTI